MHWKNWPVAIQLHSVGDPICAVLLFGPFRVTSTFPAAASADAADAASACPEKSVNVNLTAMFEPDL